VQCRAMALPVHAAGVCILQCKLLPQVATVPQCLHHAYVGDFISMLGHCAAQCTVQLCLLLLLLLLALACKPVATADAEGYVDWLPVIATQSLNMRTNTRSCVTACSRLGCLPE
jgi:hypothetical protein